MRYLVWIVLAGVLGLLIYLGTLEPYREHLLYDVSVYYQRSLYFFDHANLTDVTNEYLPVSAFYFILFSPVFFISNSLENFERIFTLGNSLLLFLLGWIIYREKGQRAVWVYALILLCAGPIVLYRFEVLVILAMILAVLRFQKKDFIGSAIFLSLGMLVKLYPLLLLPYFLILAFKQKGIVSALKYGGVFLITTGCIILFYFFATQTGFKEMLFSLDFHKDKPLGLESPQGTFTNLYYYLQTGFGAPIVARHNTWGIDDAYVLLPIPFLTYMWMIPVAALYIWQLLSKRKSASMLFVISFLIVYFFFSKIFTPQYWLWVLFLIPFLPFKKDFRLWGIALFGSLATAITQFIYPLHYFDFLGFFYNQAKQFEYLFWLYLGAIISMGITGMLALIALIKEQTIKN